MPRLNADPADEPFRIPLDILVASPAQARGLGAEQALVRFSPNSEG